MTRPHDIDSYVSALSRALYRDFRDESGLIERIASETRDHLLEQRERNVVSGLSSDDAERAAIQQFGSVRAVSQRFRRELGVTLSPIRTFASGSIYAISLVSALAVVAGIAVFGVTLLSIATGSSNPFGTEASYRNYSVRRRHASERTARS